MDVFIVVLMAAGICTVERDEGLKVIGRVMVSIELKEELFISVVLVLISWSLNQ